MTAQTPSQHAKSSYDERYRPRYHFSPPHGWMNDPNGLVYFDGEYHLFHQYHPDLHGTHHKHWGHAVSTDLVHWTHLPIAIYPDENNPEQRNIWSGSAVYDQKNTSGLVPGGGLVAIFSYADQSQAIAFSTDRGRTWTKYAGNPVITPQAKDFRDPRVFWHEPTNRWVMVLAVSDQVQVFTSPNLIDWTWRSSFGAGVRGDPHNPPQGAHGGIWECPDLFELPIEGTAGEKRWVLLVSLNDGGPVLGSATQYFVGHFDGETFTNDNPSNTVLWLDHGTDNYAGITFNNVPDGRRILIGWMSNWSYAYQVPTEPWRGAMTLPRELGLRATRDGIRLWQRPISELETLRADPLPIQLDAEEIEGRYVLATTGQTGEIVAEFERGKGGMLLGVGFDILINGNQSCTTRVHYQWNRGTLAIDRGRAASEAFSAQFPAIMGQTLDLPPADPNHRTRLKLHIFVDACSVEVFADDGETAITSLVFPDADAGGVTLYTYDGTVKVRKLEVYPLRSIWTER